MIKITGASGFVGKNLLPYLKDFKVEVLSRAQLLDVDQEELFGCEAIIHLAGKAHDLKSSADPIEYYKINFDVTKKLYDSFLKSNAKKFIFISSVKASADSVEGVLTEDMLPYPKTDYGKSKLMAENYILSQELPSDKSFFILRPCMIHGPGNKGNLNLLYQVVKRRIPYPLASFKNKRSFLSIENLCFVIKELLVQNVSSGIYQVSDDDTLSTNEVVNILSESIGRKATLWFIPTRFIRYLSKIGDLLKLPLNSERLEKLTESYCIDNSKIKRAINKEMPIASKDGMRKTAKSFKSSIL